ncbi:MAG: hypothetical protein ACFB14_21485 [Leptolyngbyaceae cyanobacterium]
MNLEADVVAGDSYKHPGLSGRTTLTGGILVGRPMMNAQLARAMALLTSRTTMKSF